MIAHLRPSLVKFFLIIAYFAVSGSVVAALDSERVEFLLSRGKLEQAKALISESLVASALEPTDASVDNIVGWTYYTMGNLLEAERFLTAAFRNSMQSGDAKIAMLSANNIGILLFSENRLAEADIYFSMPHNADSDVAKEYKRLIEAKRRDTALATALEQGKQQRYEQKFRQAVSNYETALLFEPRNVEALEYKGYSLFRLGRFDDARVALLEARAIDPARELVHLNLVKIECARGSEDEVQAAIDSSELPLDRFALWYASDLEFQSVCGKSAAIKQAVTARSNSTEPAPKSNAQNVTHNGSPVAPQ